MHLVSHGTSGPDVVLLHGIPGSGAVWREVVPFLAAYHRVHVADLLGFGGSSRPRLAEDLWADAQADALVAALDERRIDRAVLVGHDFGAPVALALAGRRPGLVTGLGVAAGNVFGDTPIPLPIRAVTWPVVGGLAARGLFSEMSLKLMIRRGSSRPLDAQGYIGDAEQTGAIGTIFAHALRNLQECYAPLEATSRALDAPVIVAWGDRDPFFSVQHGRRTAQAARRGRLVLYEGTGHFVPEERSEELAAEIRRLVADAA